MTSKGIRRTASVLIRVAIGAALAGPPVAAAPPLPDLSGEWRLNKDASDDPQQKLRSGSEGGSGGSGSSHGRGGRGGWRGRRRSDSDDSSDSRGPSPFEARTSLSIRHRDPELRITDGSGREWVLYTDDRETEDERSLGGTTKVRARWKDGRLEVTSRPERGPKTVETYAVAADGSQLTVTTRIERRRGSAVEIRSVYDPARPSPPPPPDEPEEIEITAAAGGAR